MRVVLVVRGERVEEVFAVLLGLVCVFVGDVGDANRLAEVAGVEELRLHLDQVDDAAERRAAVGRAAGSDGNHDGHRPPLLFRVRRQPRANRVERLGEVRADHVHLVDEHHPRDAVAVGLPPHGFRLRFYALLSVEHDNRTVEDAQRAFDFGGEVDVAGGIDEVHSVAQPLERHARRVDGDAPLLFFRVVVGVGGALVHAAELVLDAGVVQQVFGGRGLARVDVRNDAEVPHAGQIEPFVLRHDD